MFSFGNPKILFLLLLIPAMFGLFLLALKARTKKLKRYGRLDVVLGQIPDASRYTPWIKIGVELLLVAVVIVILARPRAKGSSTLTSKKVQGSEIVVAMEISNSMLASSTNDADGISRLQQAKFIVEKLFDRLTNDKVGLVVFAGDAYVQMPITNDFSSAKMFLNSLSTNMVSNQGTAIGAAIETSMGLFSNNPKCQKSIVLITDAENHEDDAIAAAKAAKDKGVEIDVVGVGSSSLMPSPMGGGTYVVQQPAGAHCLQRAVGSGDSESGYRSLCFRQQHQRGRHSRRPTEKSEKNEYGQESLLSGRRAIPCVCMDCPHPACDRHPGF